MLLFLFATLGAFANSSSPLDPSAKLLQCPTVPEAYGKLLTQVQVLKTKIKKDAACEPVQKAAASLENLLGDRRKDVAQLIEKSKREPLSDFENGIVRNYVEDMTGKVFSVVELLDRNNSCFAEDRKKFSFSDLSALTLDATALAQMVGGPWAMPISLGGQALAGVFRGMNLLVKNRRGFEFEDIEQRQSFATSLCTYFNYRRDMESLLDPPVRKRELLKAQASLSRQLDEINRNCPECSEVRDSRGNLRMQTVLKVDSLYMLPIGSFTVRAQESLKWINKELERTAETEAPGTELGRDFLSEVQADVDRFFFEEEAPQFLSFQLNRSVELMREFRITVRSEGELLLRQIAATGIVLDTNSTFRMNESELLNLIESQRAALQSKGERQMISRIVDHQRRSVRLYERVRSSLTVHQNFCEFFEKAGFYGRSIGGACQNRAATDLRSQMQQLSSADSGHSLFVPLAAGTTRVEVSSFVELIEGEWEKFQSLPSRFQRR
jgi:hypothetical protein